MYFGARIVSLIVSERVVPGHRRPGDENKAPPVHALPLPPPRACCNGPASAPASAPALSHDPELSQYPIRLPLPMLHTCPCPCPCPCPHALPLFSDPASLHPHPIPHLNCRSQAPRTHPCTHKVPHHPSVALSHGTEQAVIPFSGHLGDVSPVLNQPLHDVAGLLFDGRVHRTCLVDLWQYMQRQLQAHVSPFQGICQLQVQYCDLWHMAGMQDVLNQQVHNLVQAAYCKSSLEWSPSRTPYMVPSWALLTLPPLMSRPARPWGCASPLGGRSLGSCTPSRPAGGQRYRRPAAPPNPPPPGRGWVLPLFLLPDLCPPHPFPLSCTLPLCICGHSACRLHPLALTSPAAGPLASEHFTTWCTRSTGQSHVLQCPKLSRHSASSLGW